MPYFPMQRFTEGNGYKYAIQGRKDSKREKLQQDLIWQNKRTDDQVRSGRERKKKLERRAKALGIWDEKEHRKEYERM